MNPKELLAGFSAFVKQLTQLSECNEQIKKDIEDIKKELAQLEELKNNMIISRVLSAAERIEKNLPLADYEAGQAIDNYKMLKNPKAEVEKAFGIVENYYKNGKN